MKNVYSKEVLFVYVETGAIDLRQTGKIVKLTLKKSNAVG